ncbi:alanyl-tRNA synthetase-like protein, partial [Dinothrombium tinctorium]
MNAQLFLCQTDSYLQKHTSLVVCCEKSSLKANAGESIDGFDVVLEDTILFPEGGGQPDDRGTIDGKQVLKVQKIGDKAVHFVVCEQPFQIGTSVEVKVDWNRRWDHMQQHTAQHLISAVAEDTFGLVTTSWTLGEQVSTIEVDAPTIASEVFSELEKTVNERIRESRSVEMKLYAKDSEEMSKVRSRFELPENTECIRVIHIDGVDYNTCCGTHVSNLSHLQAIKFLRVEKGKKNKSNLLFVAGDRLLNYLAKCIEREKSLTALLNNESEQHVTLVEKMQKQMKLFQKNFLNVIRELAIHEAKYFISLEPKPVFYSLHRKEGQNDFISIFLNEVSNFKENTLFLLTVSHDASANSGGYIALAGSETLVKKCVEIAEQMMNAKGIIKHGRFQAK